MLYENMTFENIMDRCLSRVAASIDKREGSVVYDAIAPAAAELAIMYIELAYLLDRAFPDTEEGDDLTLKCQERSVLPNAGHGRGPEGLLRGRGRRSDGRPDRFPLFRRRPELRRERRRSAAGQFKLSV